MRLVFVLARKRRLDLVTVRAVAERRTPERSAVEERRVAYREVLGFSLTMFSAGEVLVIDCQHAWHEIG